MGIIRNIAVGGIMIFVGLPVFLTASSLLRAENERQRPSAAAAAAARQEDDVERAIKILTGPNPTSSAPVDKWRYSQEVDPMTSKSIRFASIDSDDWLSFGFPYNGKNVPKLTLRQKPGRADVYLQIDKGQFVCGVSSCTVRVRFDEGKAMDFSAAEPDDHDSKTLFILNSSRFIKFTKSAKLVRIQATFFQEGSPTMSFRTEGLKWPP